MTKGIGTIVAAALATACGGATAGGSDAGTPPARERRAPELGTGDHTPGSVTLTVVATAADGLRNPRDLAFNPLRPDELWVVNEGDESVTIVHATGSAQQTTEHRKDGYALHFMAHPAALDFGADPTTIGKPGTFATCGESRDDYDGQEPANDFMGPTLWSSDLSVFAELNPHGLGSHLDMLHESPLCMGIAHEAANVYWAFGGLANALFRYDFKTDNGIGNDDHSDGEVLEYAEGQVKYVPGVPSGLFYRASDKMLYVADTGHARIARLDPSTGTPGAPIQPLYENIAKAQKMDGAQLADVVAGLPLVAPSGLEIRNDFFYVSDNQTGWLYAFVADGSTVNWLDTGLGASSLAGMAFGPDGRLYLVDMKGNRVLRIDPR